MPVSEAPDFGHWNLLRRGELDTNQEAWSQGAAGPAARGNATENDQHSAV